MVPRRNLLISMTSKINTRNDNCAKVTFSDRLRSDPASCSSTRVNSYDYSSIKAEGEGCCAVSKFDVTVWVDIVVDMSSKEGGWICYWGKRE